MLYMHAWPPLPLVWYICITKQHAHGSLDSTNWTDPQSYCTMKRQKERERERETEIPLGIHLHKHTCDVLILSANQVNFINRQTYSRCLRFVTTFILRTKNNNMMRWDQYRRKKILRNEKLCWVEYKMATVKPALTSLVRSLSFFFCRHNF